MTAIISKDGELLFTIQSNTETVSLNIPVDGFAVDDPPNNNMYYVDENWVDMPQQPSPHYIFHYGLKQWIDPRTIEQFKEQHWQKIKAERDSLEFGGFEFESNIYDSDLTSQSRIMGAASTQVDQIWTIANNEMVELTALQLSQLYQTLQAHIATIHERGRIARQLVYEATTIEQVEEITL